MGNLRSSAATGKDRGDARTSGAGGALVLVVSLGLGAACGGASRDSGAAAPQTATPGPAAPAAAASAQDSPDSPVIPPQSVMELVDPPALTGAALPALKPAAGEPPELTALKARLLRGDSSSGVLKGLQKLNHKNAANAEVPFLLGQLYLAKLWVDDGLKLFRRAIELKPELRKNPFLIRSVVNGLGNDRDQGQVRRFLIQEVGRPATPYLEEIVYGEWRKQVKDRASATLTEIAAAPP